MAPRMSHDQFVAYLFDCANLWEHQERQKAQAELVREHAHRLYREGESRCAVCNAARTTGIVI